VHVLALSPRFAKLSLYSELIFAEEQVRNAVKNFFDTNRCGKKAVTAKNAA